MAHENFSHSFQIDLLRPDCPPNGPNRDDAEVRKTENGPSYYATNVQCSIAGILHQSSGIDWETRITLLTVRLHLNPKRAVRRLASTEITLLFSTMSQDPEDQPEVLGIAPDGAYETVPTTALQGTRPLSYVNWSRGSMIPSLQLGGTCRWQQMSSGGVTGASSVVGCVSACDILVGHQGRYATWTITEDATWKTGVPPFINLSILLKHRIHVPLCCTVDIAGYADAWTRWGWRVTQVRGKQEVNMNAFNKVSEASTQRPHDEGMSLMGLESFVEIGYNQWFGDTIEDGKPAMLDI